MIRIREPKGGVEGERQLHPTIEGVQVDGRDELERDDEVESFFFESLGFPALYGIISFPRVSAYVNFRLL
jgi:hypothetical protein